MSSSVNKYSDKVVIKTRGWLLPQIPVLKVRQDGSVFMITKANCATIKFDIHVHDARLMRIILSKHSEGKRDIELTGEYATKTCLFIGYATKRWVPYNRMNLLSISFSSGTAEKEEYQIDDKDETVDLAFKTLLYKRIYENWNASHIHVSKIEREDFYGIYNQLYKKLHDTDQDAEKVEPKPLMTETAYRKKSLEETIELRKHFTSFSEFDAALVKKQKLHENDVDNNPYYNIFKEKPISLGNPNSKKNSYGSSAPSSSSETECITTKTISSTEHVSPSEKNIVTTKSISSGSAVKSSLSKSVTFSEDVTTCGDNIIPSKIDSTSGIDSTSKIDSTSGIDSTSETDSTTSKIDSTSENDAINTPNNSSESASSKNLMVTSVQDSRASEEHTSVCSNVTPSDENVVIITSKEIETASRVASMTISEDVNEETSVDNTSSENDSSSRNDDTFKRLDAEPSS